MAISDFTILHVLGVAFLLPFLASTLALGDKGLDRVRLELLAVPRRVLLAAELGALVLRPLNLVIFALIVPAGIALAAAVDPFPSVVSLAAAFVAVLLLAAAGGRAVDASRLARRSAGVIRYLVTLLMIAMAFANFDFNWSAGSIRLFVFQRGTLLLDANGHGLLRALRPWSPSSWVMQGYVLPSLALVVLSLLAFAYTLRIRHHAEARHTGSPLARRERPAALGPGGMGTLQLLLRKELRGLALRPATVAGYLLSGALSAWICFLADPGALAIVGCLAVYLCNYGWAADMFGADGTGIRRYALAGVKWTEVALSKSLAWIIVVVPSLVPLVAVDAVRVSGGSGLSFAFWNAAVIALTLCWGTVSSTLLPSGRSGSRPAFVNQVAPFLISGSALAVTRSGLPFGTEGFDLVMGLLLAAGILIYTWILLRLGGSFDREIEYVVERMDAG